MFENSRSNIDEIMKFINKFVKKQSGGGDKYREKYKKYKQMYARLVTRYNNLVNKMKK